MKIETGEAAIIVLHSPREKLLGIIDEIGPSGIHIRAIDLSYFDDWCRAIASGEPHLSMNNYFFPMWRVERVTRDEADGTIPSMSEQFQQRTGLELGEV